MDWSNAWAEMYLFGVISENFFGKLSVNGWPWNNKRWKLTVDNKSKHYKQSVKYVESKCWHFLLKLARQNSHMNMDMDNDTDATW
jgi:hypothetical protein